MVPGRRRFYALPDDGYTESKINSRSWSPGLRTKPSGRSNPGSTSGRMTRHQVIAYLICTQKVLPDFKYSQAKMLTTDQDHQPGFAAHRLPPCRPPDGRHDYATSDHSETKIKEAAFRDIVVVTASRARWNPNKVKFSSLDEILLTMSAPDAKDTTLDDVADQLEDRDVDVEEQLPPPPQSARDQGGGQHGVPKLRWETSVSDEACSQRHWLEHQARMTSQCQRYRQRAVRRVLSVEGKQG
ncbi:unnamed protein product [Phytophthora fragariaefolia]|uniref:Unnamed protein product n=1 Tax=Phytophthora fragariaefolia TaxID=1490495 RepID=A0A9W7D204_9STRA|nr:unnamed protein product [Phytophthora fragariaefolia]